MKIHHLLLSSLAAAWLCLAPLAHAQDGDASDLRDRLNRIEKRLNEVRAIVLQARDTGKPVQVVEAGDPQTAALQSSIDDVSQSLRTLTGQVEVLTHDLDLSRKQLAASQAQTAALADRVDKLEKQLTPPPPPAPPAGGTLGGQAQAGGTDDGGPPAGDAKAAYAHARELLLSGDYPAAQAAFQDYIDHYGDTPSAPQARYWLGQTKYIQGDYQGAATALIGAIRGWPHASWAPDAVIKLSLSLTQLNKAPDACRTLVEFRLHYPAATAAEKAHAHAASVKAGCGR